jgi:hypothetical protein
MEPERGETEFEVEPKPQPAANDKWGLVFGLVFMVVCSVGYWLHPEGWSSGSSSTALSETSRPVPVQPQPQFAKFSVGSASLRFANEQIEIVRVQSEDEIPEEVRNQSVRIDSSSGHLAVLPSNEAAYILFGTVSVTVGSLTGRDRWRGNIEANAGSIERMSVSSHLDKLAPAEAAHPPPSARLRKVYVVGEIATFKGPALARQSRARYEILDLTVPQAKMVRYRQEAAEYAAARKRVLEQSGRHEAEEHEVGEHVPVIPRRVPRGK